MKFTENLPSLQLIMVDEGDTRMSVDALLDAELDGDEDESIESLFNEAFESMEDARRRTDRMQRAGVSPSTPFGREQYQGPDSLGGRKAVR